MWAGRPEVGVARVDQAILRRLTAARIHGAVRKQKCGAGQGGGAWSPRFPWRARREQVAESTLYPQQLKKLMFTHLTKALFSCHLINPINIKKTSHRIFRHMHVVLNEVYLQKFLYGWTVNRETNLMSLLNL